MSEMGVEIVAKDQATPVFAAMGQAITADTEKLKTFVAENIKLARAEDDVRKATEKTRRETQALDRDAEKLKRTLGGAMGEYTRELERAEKHLKSGRISQDDYARAVSNARDKLNEANTASQSAFGTKAIEMVKGMVAALGVGSGLAGAVKLIRDEWEAVIEAQRRAATATVTEAQAEGEALRNLGAETPAERDRYLKDIDKMSQETGVSKTDLHKRASTALSAKGALPYESAMEAVGLSAKYLPGDTEGGSIFSGAVLDQMRAGNVDATTAAANLTAVGKFSRIVDPAMIARNVAPAMLAATAKGDTLQEAGPLFAALTTKGDFRGDESKTAQIALQEQLSAFLPKESTYRYEENASAKSALAAERSQITGAVGRDAREAMLSDPEYQKQRAEIARKMGRLGKRPEDQVRREMLQQQLQDIQQTSTAKIEAEMMASPDVQGRLQELQQREAALPKTRVVDRQGTGLGSTRQRIEALRNDPQLMEQFLSGMTAELSSKEAIRQVLSGKGAVGEAYETFRKEFPTAENAKASFEAQTRVVETSPVQQTARMAQGMTTLSQNLATSDPAAARIGAIRETLVSSLRQTGMGALASQVESMKFEMGETGDLQKTRGILTGRAQQLRRGRTVTDYENFDPMSGAYGSKLSQPTEVDLKQADSLEKVVEFLGLLYEETKKSNTQEQQAKIPKALGRPDKETGVD
jgi:hypothetical protein